MNVAYTTNSWGTVYGSPAAMNNINGAYYLASSQLTEVIPQIGKAGFDSVEIFDGNLLEYEGKKSELENLLKSSGTTLMGSYVAGNFIYDEILPEELFRIEKAASFAATLGAKFLTVGGGATRYNGRKESDYAKMGAALDKVCEICDRLGIVAAYHPHMGSLVQSAEEIDKLMSHTLMPLCPDIAHIALAGSDPVAVVKKYTNRIPLVHLKDLTKEGMFCPLGMGIIDIPGVIAALKDVSPQYAVECDGYSGDPYEGAVHTYKYLEQALFNSL